VAVPISLRFAEREAIVMAKFWRGWAFSLFVMPVLFLGGIGLGLGDYVDDRTIGGLDYLTFVAPGMLAMAVFQNAAGDGLWGAMGGWKWMGHFNAAIATPLQPTDVFTGWMVSRAALMACTAVTFLVAAALLGGVPSLWGVLMVPAAVLGGLTITAWFSGFSIGRESDASFPVMIRLVILPMSFFSGTFFPLDQLPAGVKPLAMATPLWHTVELGRGATTGTLGLGDLVHLGYLVACVGLGSLYASRGFNRRLTS